MYFVPPVLSDKALITLIKLSTVNKGEDDKSRLLSLTVIVPVTVKFSKAWQLLNILYDEIKLVNSIVFKLVQPKNIRLKSSPLEVSNCGIVVKLVQS